MTKEAPPERIWMSPKSIKFYAHPDHRDSDDTLEYALVRRSAVPNECICHKEGNYLCGNCGNYHHSRCAIHQGCSAVPENQEPAWIAVAAQNVYHRAESSVPLSRNAIANIIYEAFAARTQTVSGTEADATAERQEANEQGQG